MLKFKIDVMEELKKRGYNSNRMRKEKIMPESVMTKLRSGNAALSLETINTICCILRCQISDIIEVTPTDEEKIKYF